MSQYGQRVVAIVEPTSTFATQVNSLFTDVTQLTARMDTLTANAPEVLDTLKEIADAINTDPAFFTTMATANTTLQTNIDAEGTTRTAAVTALQGLIDAATAARTALSGRLDTLEADSTTATAVATAIAAVQADVDQNESDADAADTALGNRITVLEADPTTATALAAVQADVDQNETDADTAIAGVQADLATETTARGVAIAALQADVDTNEADADAAIALKADKAGDTFTGDILLRSPTGNAVSLKLSRADHPDMSCEWKVTPSYVSADKECLSILAAGQPVAHFDERQRVSINKTDPDYTLDVEGDGSFSTGLSIGGLTNAANDSAAATAGVAVNQLYRNGSVVMIRVS